MAKCVVFYFSSSFFLCLKSITVLTRNRFENEKQILLSNNAKLTLVLLVEMPVDIKPLLFSVYWNIRELYLVFRFCHIRFMAFLVLFCRCFCCFYFLLQRLFLLFWLFLFHLALSEYLSMLLNNCWLNVVHRHQNTQSIHMPMPSTKFMLSLFILTWEYSKRVNGSERMCACAHLNQTGWGKFTFSTTKSERANKKRSKRISIFSN